jgi:hypothetical protein
MKKQILTLLFIPLMYNFSYSQEVEIIDDKVLVENKAILRYEKSNFFNHSFFSLGSDEEEVIFYSYNQNETPSYSADDYFAINFLFEKIKVESKNIRKVTTGLGMNSRKNMEKLLIWLLKEKVLNIDGTINNEKVKIFQDKYNENITNRTIRN